MLCHNCNSEISDSSKFCTYCGKAIPENTSTDHNNNYQSNEENYFTRMYSMENSVKPRRKLPKLPLIITAAVIAFVLAAAPILYLLYNNVYLFNKHVSSVMNEVEKKNFKKAKSSYDLLKKESKNNKENKVITAIDSQLKKKTDKLSDDYIKNKFSYTELQSWFTGLNEFPSLKDKIIGKENDLKKYKNSRDSMSSADSSMKNKDYINAVKGYKEVIKEDVPNYLKAQNNIKTCIKDMYSYYIGEADKMDYQGNFENAYKTVKSLKEYYPEDEKVKSKMDSYLKDLFNDTLSKADKLNSQKKFDDAISTIEGIDSYFPSDKKLAQKINDYKKNKIAAVLEEQARKEKRKKDLIARTSSRYDSKYDIKVYSPKGFSSYYVNIDENVNIEPRLITYSAGTANLMIILGFIQEGYIEFTKVAFEIDGEMIEWEIPKASKKKQAIYGGIGEWCLMLDALNSNMIEQLNKIVNGKDVKIIFEGKKYRNHVLTNKERDMLKLFIELYGYYDHGTDLDTPDTNVEEMM